MPDVTITITVSGEKGTVSVGGGGAPAGAALLSSDAPSYDESGSPETLFSGLEDVYAATGSEGDDADGPAPMELTELGVSGDATDRATAVGDDSPPEEIEEAAQGDDASGDEDEEVGPDDVGEPPGE